MIDNQVFLDVLSNPVRELVGRVELYIYEDSTLVQVCGCSDALQSFTIERVGENKFFGYGICHRLNFKLMDMDRRISVSTKNYIEVELGEGSEYIYPFPAFYITEVNRDETTNQLSVTAYDVLYRASEYTVGEIDFPASYTIREFLGVCANFLRIPLNIESSSIAFDLEYAQGANLTGTETIREALNAVAEATQTIYYIDSQWQLCFKELDRDGDAVFTIDKSKYFSLDSNDNKRLGTITHATDLGDNLSASIEQAGSTQYLRNNPFLDTREDVNDILNDAIDRLGGLTINQFNCNWRGNWLLEIGDKINVVTRDNEELPTYLLNDVITYNGTLSEKTQWQYDNNDTETESNATTIGGALKSAFAKVDKVNSQVQLVASEVDDMSETVSQLVVSTDNVTAIVQRNTEAIESMDGIITTNTEDIGRLKVEADSISMSVERNMTNTNTQLDAINQNIDSLSHKVSGTMSAEDVKLLVSTTTTGSSASVTTDTGFTFNEEGMTVSKSDSEMSTTITEDGMLIRKNNETMLTVNNHGVIANNLRSNYIIISNRCRFEKYGADRAGCFWLGGE